jgi:hypothetical protein
VDGVYRIRWAGGLVSGEVGVAGGEQRRRRCSGRKGNEQERTRRVDGSDRDHAVAIISAQNFGSQTQFFRLQSNSQFAHHFGRSSIVHLIYPSS